MLLPKKMVDCLDEMFIRHDGIPDYCSCSPDIIFGVDIGECCRLHDQHYHMKGISKEEADIQFRENIKAQGGFLLLIVAWVYYFAVKYLAGEEW